MSKLNILVANDDGINAIGIKLLVEKLKKYGNIYVCAPESGRSASGHSIVLHDTLSFEYVETKENVKWYKTSGMPADCVRLPIDLLDVEFDIVFSGVNNGLNIGTDIIYSGTVAAAREANIEYIPAVAISTDFDSFDIVEKELDSVLELVFNKKLYSKDYVLNINFPTSEHLQSCGIKVCKQGIKRFKTTFVLTENNRYANTDNSIIYDTREDTDVYLASQGYITLVPLKVEQTNYEAMETLKENI